MHVADIYSSPRIVEMAKRMGLRGGWSIDLIIQGEIGAAWGLNKAHVRNKAIRRVLQDKPFVPIGSPMCIAYSTMNNTNYPKMMPEEVQQRPTHARKHLDVCAKLYEIQWQAGGHLLHEHPYGASPRQEDSIQRFMKRQE